jgi:replicative DNA helicase
MIAEIEYAVLSGALTGLVDPEFVVKNLGSYEFDDPEAQTVFDELKGFVVKGAKPNRLLIKNKCGTAVSDDTWLFIESAEGDDEDTFKGYIEVLKQKSFREKLKRICRAGLAKVEDGEDPDEIYNTLQSQFTNLDAADSNKKSKTMKELAKAFLVNFKKRVEAGESVSGLSSSFDEFDEMTSGLHPGDLIVVAGRPGMGKTTFAINIGEGAAMKGKRVIVYSFEMPGEQLFQRNLASIGSIDYTHIKNGQLSELEAGRFHRAVKTISNLDIEVDDSSGLDIHELRKRVLKHHRTKKLDLIIIDYLQLMKMSGGSTDNKSSQIGEITGALKGLAKDLGIPIILLSQLNRSLEQRPNKRPINSDLRESGAIEQDADVIVFVYRDEYYNPASPDAGKAELIIAKQRSGPLGTVMTRFVGKYSRFENLPKDAANDTIEYQEI